MRYHKPIVMDLSAAARSAAGQDPLGCYNGNGTVGGGETCQNGTAPPARLANPCTVGPDPGTSGDPVCISGNSPAVSFCMVGAGGSGADTCTSGPDPY
jgi:hypothetical protein